jgi:hypothetical protein
MKCITLTVAAGFLIAIFACPGTPRAQSEPQAAGPNAKITLKILAAQVAALQATVNSQQTTLNSQQTTLNSLQGQLSAESPINALAANFLDFDGTEADGNLPPLPGAQGGARIYSNSVTVPPGTNTLYVTIGATADLGGVDNALFISCLVDGLPCTSATIAANSSPTGWIMMEDLSATAQPTLPGFPFADNNFSYTWCTHISATPSNSHALELRLASAASMSSVFMEQYHVFVNGAMIQDPTQACTPGRAT